MRSRPSFLRFPTSALAAAALFTLTAESPISATAELGGGRYQFSGAGECIHGPESTIYEVPATMWHASFDADGKALSRVNLTLWQPKKGGPIQVTLFAQAGSKTFELATVPGGPIKGIATGRVEPRGKAATLIVEGTTAAGQPIKLSLSCSGFVPPEDNG